MAQHLPTFVSAAWAMTSLRSSLRAELNRNTWGTELRLFMYAVTENGWKEIRDSARRWLRRAPGRRLVAYVGTDHGLTEAKALQKMKQDGCDLRLLVNYTGIFHPKVIWLSGEDRHLIWAGSNNLTFDGLAQNIEFATLTQMVRPHPKLICWFKAVHKASAVGTDEAIREYEDERKAYGYQKAKVGAFTWSRRSRPRRRERGRGRGAIGPRVVRARQGDLIIEIMPKETGTDGNQIQVPKGAAVSFFRLPNRVRGTREIELTNITSQETRPLKMTLFANNTARLVIHELDFQDRPCVVIFKRLGRNRFGFQIVRRSIFPMDYQRYLTACTAQTRTGSRRWCYYRPG